MGDSKQVKVDNWGIFFLQRLQHFFNKTYYCDLTLQFNNNVQLKVHRLVLNACTDYFQVLEQTCVTVNECLVMPANLQADVLVPIVNFMYTGILEFQESIFDQLYAAAKLMNITVLTKLLDAQKVPISVPKPVVKRSTSIPTIWNAQRKPISKSIDDLPEPLPGRKLPIWKRKLVQSTATYRSFVPTKAPDKTEPKYHKSKLDEPPRPTRFEWPEDDDMNTNFEAYSFDEISYTSKPLVQPTREKSPKPSTSTFEEIKRNTIPLKRASSPIGNQNKKVNIQDVKEYLKEQKLRKDFIDYDDSETADNDLQSYNDDDSGEEDRNENLDDNSDETNKMIKTDKRTRLSSEGKENAKVTAAKSNVTKSGNNDMSNHTKIITEVLKKYPHLVQKNKNIRLKILAKGVNSNTNTPTKIGTPVKVPKSATKVSYMVMKPEAGGKSTPGSSDKESGPYFCSTCNESNPIQFDSYYLYRKHRTEVHMDKTDSQMCDLCGHVSRKQNMLLYHKFVKHNIEPPTMFMFPKCNECDYIAPSPALLVKHSQNHSHVELVCAECDTVHQSKTALLIHQQFTGHVKTCMTKCCHLCDQRFATQSALDKHFEESHQDVIDVKGSDFDELDENELDNSKEAIKEMSTEENEHIEQPIKKCKEKFKILSDIKVNTPINPDMLPSRTVTIGSSKVTLPQRERNTPLEPSSEAEALSNVASGIAASLGLVDTIVVLDDNQFIIQQEHNNSNNSQRQYILPQITGMENAQNIVSQDQVVTPENNAIVTQAGLDKTSITSTDELVMVLTDHDYGDANNTTVIPSDNSNIVVLYSHPVQNTDTQFITQQGMMLGSELNMIDVNVNNDYEVTNNLPIEKCEESIEMIQQELNNHLEQDIAPNLQKNVIEQTETEIQVQNQSEEELIEIKQEAQHSSVNEMNDSNENIELKPKEENNLTETSIDVSEKCIPVDNSLSEPPGTYEEPMEIEESIELIQKELNRTDEDISTSETAEPLQSELKEDNIKTDSSNAILKTETIELIGENNLKTAPSDDILNAETGIINVTEETIEESAEPEDKIISINSEDGGIKSDENNINCVKLGENFVDEPMDIDENNSVKDISLSNDVLIPDDSEIDKNNDMSSNEIIPDSEEENTVQSPDRRSEEIQPIEGSSDITELSHKLNDENEVEIVIKDESTIKTEILEEKNNSDVQEDTQDLEEIKSNESLEKETSKMPQKSKISNLLDDWDDGDTDSQQSDLPKPMGDNNSINRLIDDWEDEEET